ncbi:MULTISPECIES: acetyl-CoA C-acyltransferase [Protofrankia]|uniref:Acetyl-CoA acetyltransferase n=1 Tax=Protofrankia coriariae TaxID=1562887 RepID=A0ABR5EZB2_9ACTN|nr:MULTISPECIES: acetyl-CoA C-acyltransferase [Protofrankia]KLL09799.1 acetyl-CoA acetyltransferase [Protofrankia coriariae]ONH31335.1 acetyl-CoA acetyltransferase [Protofrankia sp. BMG5.30]
MRDAVVVEAVRTPLGKRGGGLADVHPADLSAAVLRELARRTDLDPALVDDVVWGCVGQVGEQTGDIARTAALSAGWPEHVPGVTVDRACGSSQQALSFAAAGVIAGHYDVAVAGGVESMSRIPMGLAFTVGGDPYGGAGWQKRFGTTPHQGLGAEIIAERWGFSRNDLDRYALESHARAAAALDSGAFDREVVVVDGLERDEGIRRGGTLESLAALKTAFKDDGAVTAGNASQITDGAAALLVTTSEIARHHGWEPLARVHTSVVIGDDPIIMLTGPIPATRKALKRAHLKVDDIGAFEVNEAFASVPLAWLAEIGADSAIVNPRGGAIALGHPVGGSGARIATTLLHHMRDNRIRYGLQTMCEGGGQANATIFELL